MSFGVNCTFISNPRARFSNVFLHRNSNSIEASSCCNFIAGHQNATKNCAWHDSTAVVPCTNFCSDHLIRIEVRVKQNFHRIWIAMEKPLVKRGPDRTLNSPSTACHTCMSHLGNDGQLPGHLLNIQQLNFITKFRTGKRQADEPGLWHNCSTYAICIFTHIHRCRYTLSSKV